jgi:Domain of unknown function (DUF4160)/Protein of unknown function (DUF2442)
MLGFSPPRVLSVRHVRGHVLRLRFSDGLEGEVNFAPRLAELDGPMLAPLHDATLFARVRVVSGSLAWPNGADWSPESLHGLVAAAKGTEAESNDAESWATLRQREGVPEISRFYGIVISMYYVDQARPHFHARYGGQSISMEIEGDGLSGSFPPHRLSLLYEWRDANRGELLANWERMRRGERPLAIAPLE